MLFSDFGRIVRGNFNRFLVRNLLRDFPGNLLRNPGWYFRLGCLRRVLQRSLRFAQIGICIHQTDHNQIPDNSFCSDERQLRPQATAHQSKKNPPQMDGQIPASVPHHTMNKPLCSSSQSNHCLLSSFLKARNIVDQGKNTSSCYFFTIPFSKKRASGLN